MKAIGPRRAQCTMQQDEIAGNNTINKSESGRFARMRNPAVIALADHQITVQ